MKKTLKKAAKAKKTVKRAVEHASKNKPSKAKSQNHDIHYVCYGNCLGLATKKQFEAGSKKCSVVVCSHYGRPLVRMHYCKKCSAHFSPSKAHACKA